MVSELQGKGLGGGTGGSGSHPSPSLILGWASPTAGISFMFMLKNVPGMFWGGYGL